MPQQQEATRNTTSDRSLLTDKELHYVKDFLSWELLAMKKCREAAAQCEDSQIANIIEQAGRRHLQHYESLLSHLQQPGGLQ